MCRLLKLAALVAAFVFLAPVVAALAHQPVRSMSIVVEPDPYEGLKDPVTGLLCCGGEDCAVLDVQPGMLTPGDDGIRLRMTEEQARVINPKRVGAVDTVIPFDRVQPTPPEWGAQYRVCIPPYKDPTRPRDFFCFWAPPNS
ncbi:MAG: hypothetical protein ABFD96_05920 [Armatimonadia bacterium]